MSDQSETVGAGGHTEGPWKYVTGSGYGGSGSQDVIAEGGCAPKHICSMPLSRSYVDEANAALIARAPELLAENERLRGQVAELVGAGDGLAGCLPSEKDWHEAREAWDGAKLAALSRTEPEQGKDGGE